MEVSKRSSLERFYILLRLTTQEFVKERKNVALLLLGITYFVFYQTRQFSEDLQQIAADSIIFSSSVTETLQVYVLTHFPNTFWIIDWVASLLYVFAFTFVLASLLLVMITTGREAWRYGLAWLVCGLAQFSLQIMFPVLVPIRSSKDIRPIRKEIWPSSEKLVGIKYGGIPSGHFGYSIFGILLTKRINYRRMNIIYILNTLIFPPIVLYLGEHYIVDLIASLILFPTIYLVILRVIEHLVGKAKYPTVFELAQMVEHQ
ncbi:MAG: phosphatase PAP2 family protein [Candidatus Heimdallarchaeota archaeon]